MLLVRSLGMILLVKKITPPWLCWREHPHTLNQKLSSKKYPNSMENKKRKKKKKKNKRKINHLHLLIKYIGMQLINKFFYKKRIGLKYNI